MPLLFKELEELVTKINDSLGGVYPYAFDLVSIKDIDTISELINQESNILNISKNEADTCLGFFGESAFKEKYGHLRAIRQSIHAWQLFHDTIHQHAYTSSWNDDAEINDDVMCHRVFVCQNQQEVQALMSVTFSSEEIVLEVLAVRNSCMKKGIGTACLRFIQGVSDALGYDVVLESATNTMSWYEGFGFCVDVEGRLMEVDEAGYETDFSSMSTTTKDLLEVGFFKWDKGGAWGETCLMRYMPSLKR